MIKYKLHKYMEDDGFSTYGETFYMFMTNKKIGTVELSYIGKKSVSIDKLEISDKYRRKGCGKNFVNYIESYLKIKGKEKIYLDPNTSIAVKFWKSMGYNWDRERTEEMSKKI